MAFGQASGPPATAKQVAELEERLAAAGFDSFREARHPYGLTQRQAKGLFTRDEADELLARLEQEAEGGSTAAAEPEPPPVRRTPVRRPAPSRPASPRASRTPAPEPEPVTDVVTAFPDELLAEELVRRGWTCTPPER